jgi:transposase
LAVVQQPHNKAKIHTQKQRRCKDAATKTRYQIVRLYGEGYREEEIEQITGCSRISLMEWCRAHPADHAQSLVDKRAGGNRFKLSKLHIEELQQMLHQYTPTFHPS